ncbi:9609_t:CDS:2 [Entrophospora sp. SA101]|nr:9609_t:CDS:2 [Entrophospora sp. SA101]
MSKKVIDRDLLKDLLKKYGNDYGRLAEYFPGRTFKSIKNQATKMKKGDEGYVGLELDDNGDVNTNHFNDGKLESNGRKRAIWSSSEIKKLVDLVRIYSGEWSKISEIMKNRSSDACSRKYYTLIDNSSSPSSSSLSKELIISCFSSAFIAFANSSKANELSILLKTM